MSEPATVETVDHAAEPQSDLWTADSERAALDTSDPVTPTEPVTLEADAPAAEPVAEPVTPDPTTERDSKGQFTRKGKPRNDPQARVEQATAREAAAKEDARLAREEAARYRAELDTARRPATPPTPAPVTGPTFPAYDAWASQHPEGSCSYEDYQDARVEWRLDQRLTALQSQQSERARWDGHTSRLQAAAAADPTLPTLIQTGTQELATGLHSRGLLDSNGHPTLPPALLHAVLDAPNSVDLYRYLLSHPTEAVQLAVDVARLPADAAPVVRRLLDSQVATAVVARPDSTPVVHPSAARPPVNRVGGSATVTPASPDDLEFGPEYLRVENARERKAREAGRW